MASRIMILVAVLSFNPSLAKADRIVGDWTRCYEGVEYATGSDDTSRLQKVYALRISLGNPDVHVAMTTGNGNLPYETTLQTTPSFVVANNLKCAVNANYFDTYGGYADLQGPFISSGLSVSQGGSWADKLLLFHTDNTPLLGQFSGNPVGWWNGVAGDVWMLVNGVTNNGWTNEIEPRTAAGLSQDRKFLILVVIDGRQPGWSDGANWAELAQWCEDFGAWNAINLDGGGSSCMVVANPSNGMAQVVNEPSDGFPRDVGSNFGINSAIMGTCGPEACSMNSNRVDMVLRGNQNLVYLKTWDGSGVLNSFAPIGSLITYDTPAIVSRQDGILDAFARETNNFLCHAHYENGSWSNWESIATNVLSGPSAGSTNCDNWEVLYRGANNNVFSVSWTDGLYQYCNHGGTTFDQPSVVSRKNGENTIFVRGYDNALWYTTIETAPILSIGQINSGTISLTWPISTNFTLEASGNLSSDPQWEIVTNSPTIVGNRFSLILDRNMNERFFTLRQASTQPVWTSLGGYMTSGPSGTSINPTNLQVAYRGANGNLYNVSWNGDDWSTENLGGSLAGIPAITVLKHSNSVSIFVRDSDDNLLQKIYDPILGWNSFTFLGSFY